VLGEHAEMRELVVKMEETVEAQDTRHPLHVDC
jgi:hypothetical protein